MSEKNPWVNYITRSYETIKNSLIGRLTVKTPELNDHSESNIFILLISMFSGLVEQLNYYIDNMARESFISTARKFSSVVKLSRLIDYRIKSYLPSSTDLTMTFNNPIPGPQPFTIPVGTIFSSRNDLTFTSTKTVIAPVGATSVSIPVKQQIFNNSILLGTTSGVANEFFETNQSIVDGSLSIVINNELWQFRNTLGLSGPNDLHFTTNVTETGILIIIFGDDFNGKIPDANQSIFGNFYSTEGLEGNLPSNSIVTIESPLSYPSGITATVNNDFPSTGGLDIEDITKIRKNTPLSVRTLDRAVTKQDYEDITILAPGIMKAKLFFDCSKPIDIYIYPLGGGNASISLINDTTDFINQRKMVGTQIKVSSAGESYPYFEIDVTGKFRFKAIEIQTQIIQALKEYLSPETSEINKPIRKSDVYSLIDNLTSVDFLNIKKMYIKPYARPRTNNIQLNWDIFLLNITTEIKWRLEFNGVNFNLFKNNQFIEPVNLNTLYTDSNNLIQLKINSGPYITGEIYDFTTIPMDTDLLINDFSIPIVKSNLINLNITETNI